MISNVTPMAKMGNYKIATVISKKYINFKRVHVHLCEELLMIRFHLVLTTHLSGTTIIPTLQMRKRVCVLCHVRLFVTPRTVAHQPSLSMGFSRQESWSE